MQELNEAEIQSLYAWIDEIPLTRPKRNMARDFADGLAAAEVVHYYLPGLVDLHNYSPANGVTQKVYNWNTLNQKVFRKLGYILADDIIQCISASRPGYIEYFLYELKGKLEEYLQEHPEGILTKPMAVTAPKQTKPRLTKDAPKSNPGLPTKFSATPNVQISQHKGGYDFAPQQPPVLQRNASFQQHPSQYPSAQPMQVAASYPMHQQQQQPQVVPYYKGGGVVQQGVPVVARVPSISPTQQHSQNQRDQLVGELQETIQILQLKVSKLEQLVSLKDQRIDELAMRLKSHGLLH